MIIIGAKGFSKELLTVLMKKSNNEKDIFFFDDISKDLGDNLFGKFPIIKSIEETKHILAENPYFALGLGSPQLRRKMTDKFEFLGGKLKTVISPKAVVGIFGVEINQGVCIMCGSVITSDIKIGKGVLINLNCTVGHDSKIGDFVECSPGVHISGNVRIGNNTAIGSGAVILPNIRIGNNCVIGAGSVVRENIPDNKLVVGVPAKIIRDI
ncbi:acetyltransferase [Marivirga salinae]|uniref:Acetyltransferase n=1 Tax=Marivirga salinarum TaxID=3059078 RepID=A0AA51NBA2_9BACT|nr:acetyltransferase [Marivirga sp. BDSF4-3]WMN12187.1 acetyltransferase [Marivirga sp. BDSF4-3]